MLNLQRVMVGDGMLILCLGSPDQANALFHISIKGYTTAGSHRSTPPASSTWLVGLCTSVALYVGPERKSTYIRVRYGYTYNTDYTARIRQWAGQHVHIIQTGPTPFV